MVLLLIFLPEGQDIKATYKQQWDRPALRTSGPLTCKAIPRSKAMLLSCCQMTTTAKRAALPARSANQPRSGLALPMGRSPGLLATPQGAQRVGAPLRGLPALARYLCLPPRPEGVCMGLYGAAASSLCKTLN